MSLYLIRRISAIVFLVLFSTLLQSCDEHVNTKPNVLFIAIDDLASMLGSYGNQLAKTPNFDKLSEMGVQFNRA